MGMTCSFHRASDADIERVRDDPEALREFLDPDDGSSPPVREVRPKGLLGFLLRLTPITVSEVDPDWEPGPAADVDPERVLDIEKAWHGLHFLLTGTADEGDEPACFIVRGGEPLDDEGYARALGRDAVARFARFLESLSRTELAARFDAERMTELDIYPGIWERHEESPVDWLLHAYDDVREFIVRAAGAGDCVIVEVA